MALLSELKARLRLDTAGFAKGLKGVQRDTLSLGQKMRAALVPAALALSGMAAGLALAVKGQLDQADEMSKAAQKFGVPIKELSKLAHAGDMSGVSIETLGLSLGQLSKKMQAAMGGGKAAKLFTDLGISVKDADGKMRSTEFVLGEVADKLAAMPDGAEKTALAMQLLGKSGAEMIPMLNGGSEALRAAGIEAEAMGLVIDEKTGKAAENFNDNISRLKGTLTGLVVQLTAALAPTLERISNLAVKVAQWFQKLSPETKAWAAAIVAVVAALIPAMIAVGALSGAMSSLIGIFRTLTLLFMTNPIGAAVALIAGGAYLIYTKWDGISAWFAEKWAAVKAATSEAWENIKGTITGVYDSVVEKWTGLSGWFEQKLAEIPEVFRAAWEDIKAVAAGWYDDFLAIGGQIVDGLKQGIMDKWDALVSWFDGLGTRMSDSIKETFGIKSPSRVFRAIGQFITEGLGLGIKDNAPMAEAALDGVAEKINGKARSLSAGMEAFRSSAKSTFTSVITGAKSAGDAVRDFAKNWLMGQANRYAGLAFDGIASLFGFAKGGVFEGGRVTAFAQGGVVSRPTNFAMAGGALGLMGEAGPEAILPLSRGAGGRLGVMAQGGGTSVLQVVLGDGLEANWLQKSAGISAQIVSASASAQSRTLSTSMASIQARGTR